MAPPQPLVVLVVEFCRKSVLRMSVLEEPSRGLSAPPLPAELWSKVLLLIFRAPRLTMAPPLQASPLWLSLKVQLSIISEPPLLTRMAPPSALAKPFVTVRCVRVSAAPDWIRNSAVMFWPLTVIWSPPSMLAVVVTIRGVLNRMLCGPGPQLKLMDPPAASAVARSASVQPMAAPLQGGVRQPALAGTAGCVATSSKAEVRMRARRRISHAPFFLSNSSL